MAIESFLLDAIQRLQEKNYPAAMAATCIAFDATAKQEYKKTSTRRSTRRRPDSARHSRGACPSHWAQFVQVNLDIIMLIGFGGLIRVTHAAPGRTLRLNVPQDPALGGTCIPLEDIIYKSIRGFLIHEAKLPTNVRFTEEALYGVRSDVFHIPVLFIYALILAVIGASTNASLSFGSSLIMTVHGTNLVLDELWGNADKIRKLLGLAERGATPTA
jgi:hypothetical protein